MSVLIKDMEMPENCNKCGFSEYGQHLYCSAMPDNFTGCVAEDAKPNWCPLVELIRCQDCDWWTQSEDSLQGHCLAHNMYPTGGYYCGTARPKKENE